ncbi:hypothetical protein ACCUM_2362 [Candidatus Accumulibacter phosphatis]|uniref:Uncharacterized protein n=1 Tax=Candidatus Accumulibacter phosphatis TaxID=327160 RepID=A0A5S4FB17_9PROT|nr:hypothetical protein ACCUM_2362 [Candidatus Accumulibacter phosphatis]
MKSAADWPPAAWCWIAAWRGSPAGRENVARFHGNGHD